MKRERKGRKNRNKKRRCLRNALLKKSLYLNLSNGTVHIVPGNIIILA